MTAFFRKRTMIITFYLLLLLFIGYFILPISVPLVTAFITALLLDPIVHLLQNKGKIKRHFSVLIVFLLFLLLITFSTLFLTTKVIAEVIQIAENLPNYINDITNLWLNIEKSLYNSARDLPPEFVFEVSNQVEQFLQDTKNYLISAVNIENIKVLFTNIPNYLVNLLVYLIALFLFLLDLPRLKLRFYSHLTESTAEKVNFMFSRLSYVVMGFVKAQFLVSIVIFVASLIGLLLIVPEVALFMSLLIWVIDVIPILGSIIIMGPWTLFYLLSGDMAMATKLGILTAVLLIIRRTLEPKVMGSQIGLSPLSTLISMYLGLKLFGVLGFFIGPLILIVYNSAREAGIIKLNIKI
ncbi:sporulation integral membrane protein YtvI [Bacillus alveayuensis]|uniref:sporulation integral membrane protein YtvI n=1 Tax=Aeribacillus alveayuensis TaxID=279215 RepID=UPI0005D1234C|nr:sporulation integral membrane protein YtvI [Bacillus alveayuensis]